MKDTFRLCRKCGRPIGVIQARAYKKIIVDADTQFVHADPYGEVFIRIDGTKMRGRTDDRWSKGTVKPEFVWNPHRCHEV